MVFWAKRGLGLAATLAILSATRLAGAHHEALFGPQSSIAVESDGFVSVQSHAHAYGVRGTQTNEATYLLSAGLSPLDHVPWSLAVVQPFTYQTTAAPTPPGSTGPFSACDGCLRRENNLVSTSYRFAFRSLQGAWGQEGNFALVSVALEPPTGNKDYPTFRGPFNAIAAGMIGFEWRSFSLVALGYYRRNTPDSTSSKKGDNVLAALGLAYTPFESNGALLSFQVGVGDELHFPDVDRGTNIAGGNEIVVSPTIVASPHASVRMFALVSVPAAQSYRADYEVDRWRVGVGVIWSFVRAPPSSR